MMKQRINIYEILRTDQACIVFVGLILAMIIVTIIVYGSIEIFGGFRTKTGGLITEEDVPYAFVFEIVVVVVCLLGIIIRYLYFRNILAHQVPVNGVIDKVSYDKYNEPIIAFNYEFNGKKFERKKHIAGGNYQISQAIKKGTGINVLINNKNPKQFIIADLYKSARSII